MTALPGRRWWLALACAGCCLPSWAQEKGPAPMPVPVPPLAIVGEWDGPFKDTKIVKLLDAEDGVACYLYIPRNVPSNTVCKAQDDCAIHYPGGIGSLSCVKSREPVAVPKAAPPKR